MVDFKSGLWTNEQGSHCMWEEEKPEEEDEKLGFYFNSTSKEWKYDKVESSSDDYQLADWPLTSWV